MSNLTISIDITKTTDENGAEVEEYTPTIIYNDGKKETPLSDFETFAMKWSKSGRGKGLKAEVKLRSPVMSNGTLKLVNKTFAIPEELSSVIDLAKFITKSVPQETVAASKGKPAIKVEEADLNPVEVEDVAEAVV